ncbi:hypothetical protein [Enorma phocaeensis]|uniref:hypothetical protein n=1 Tax=Enorma phocaeensis TaxID=1871019 RepID=UPI00195D4598|nr:hypothetical protein [Enorma phocaeensis]MBM6953119.1 hypothetical protein [Enorma phocaeensis]
MISSTSPPIPWHIEFIHHSRRREGRLVEARVSFVDRAEWELARDDILAGYPPDLR